MELTVDQVLADLKEVSKRQEDLQIAEARLHADVHKIDNNSRLLLGSLTVSETDRSRLIEGISSFVAETYKRSVALALRTQGRKAEPEGEVELSLTGGGFPRMA